MTDHVQPDWSGAPDWANFWAADSDGYGFWYRSEPTFDYDGDNTYGIAGVWLPPQATGDSDIRYDQPPEPSQDMQFDATWPPEGFDDWVIDWDKTLRSRP